MVKVKEFSGITQKYRFNLTIYKDESKSSYHGKYSVFSPPLYSKVEPGQPTPTMELITSDEIYSDDLSNLVGLSKRRITEICGEEIIRFSEK